jgi:hypothetical protein
VEKPIFIILVFRWPMHISVVFSPTGKMNPESGDVGQCKGTCLACLRPWVSPHHWHKQIKKRRYILPWTLQIDVSGKLHLLSSNLLLYVSPWLYFNVIFILYIYPEKYYSWIMIKPCFILVSVVTIKQQTFSQKNCLITMPHKLKQDIKIVAVP